MAEGIVKWFDEKKGYGFIQAPDGGPDIFVHYTGIDGEGFKTLAEGDTVNFNLVVSDKGPKAEAVTRVGQPAAAEPSEPADAQTPEPAAVQASEPADAQTPEPAAVQASEPAPIQTPVAAVPEATVAPPTPEMTPPPPPVPPAETAGPPPA